MGKPSNSSILDFESEGRLEIRHNSEWLKNLNHVRWGRIENQGNNNLKEIDLINNALNETMVQAFQELSEKRNSTKRYNMV